MKKGNNWDDHYTKRAKGENWLARSVYKLEEIDRKQRLIRNGARVLDLGCYPGSWSQYILEKVGKNGEVIGIDLETPQKISAPNFRFIRGDLLKIDPDILIQEAGEVDLLLSDMAPNTTGSIITDCARSLELANRALDVAIRLLKKDHNFLCKVFEGEDFKCFKARVTEYFGQVRLIRPSAVRKRSREIYLLGIKKF
ncbi:MAG: RlmE family RNA methyltransferase [Deltaproteobacteria bacterium]|nr:RlmE family RNA methyltransferase [Deltaproteobacteria bacterium]